MLTDRFKQKSRETKIEAFSQMLFGEFHAFFGYHETEENLYYTYVCILEEDYYFVGHQKPHYFYVNEKLFENGEDYGWLQFLRWIETELSWVKEKLRESRE